MTDVFLRSLAATGPFRRQFQPRTSRFKGRVWDEDGFEAFSDGVIAIIITIMVLELAVPHGDTMDALRPLAPVFLSYVLSFVHVGIYWNNHHHLLHTVRSVSGAVLWSNLHLLFWLSLVPFVTGWMGENHFASLPVAMYGAVLMMSGVAYYLLTRSLVRSPWRGLGPGAGARQRFQGQGIGADLCRWPSRWRSSTAGSRSVSTSAWQHGGSFPIGGWSAP